MIVFQPSFPLPALLWANNLNELKVENIRVNKIFISGVIYKEVWFVYPSHGKNVYLSNSTPSTSHKT